MFYGLRVCLYNSGKLWGYCLHFADGWGSEAESGGKWAVVESPEGWITCIWNLLRYMLYLLNMCSCFLFWISLTGIWLQHRSSIKELANYRSYVLFNGHVSWFGKQSWVNSINFCFSFSSPFYPAIIITYFVIFMWIDDMILDVNECTTITSLMPSQMHLSLEWKGSPFSRAFSLP